MDAEGKEPSRQLSEHTADSIAFSPDGQRLLFAERPRLIQRGILWLANADGSNLIKVLDFTDGRSVTLLSWSPDGKYISYLQSGQGGGLMIADANGANPRRLTDKYASGWGFPPPAWSPDSRYLAFIAQEKMVDKVPDAYLEAGAFRYNNIHLIDLQTGQESRLVPDSQVGNFYPAWSPDGSLITFVSNRTGVPTLWVIGRDGTNLRPLPAINVAQLSMPIWLSTPK